MDGEGGDSNGKVREGWEEMEMEGTGMERAGERRKVKQGTRGEGNLKVAVRMLYSEWIAITNLYIDQFIYIAETHSQAFK